MERSVRNGVLATAVALLLGGGQVGAAEIRLVDGTKQDGRQQIILEGEITKGDFERIQSLAANAGARIYLDSPGGDYREGLKIARFVRESHFATRIPNGAVCYSACALIFMHGTGIEEAMEYTDRALAPAAKLGFHAPYLRMRDGGPFATEVVEQAYTEALTALADLLESSRDIMSNSLVWEMLRVGPDDLLIVDTYAELLAWDIRIDYGEKGWSYPPVKSIKWSDMALACQTIIAIRGDKLPSYSIGDARRYIDSGRPRPDLIDEYDGRAIYRLSMSDNPEQPELCYFSVFKRKDGSLFITYDPDVPERNPAFVIPFVLDARFFREPAARFDLEG